MADNCVAYNDVSGKWQDFLAWNQPRSRDSRIPPKRSKEMGVWSKMGLISQLGQNIDEIPTQWCEINDSIHGGVRGLMGGVPNRCLIGQTRLP